MVKPFDSARPKDLPPICGIVCGSSWHAPVACAYPPGHDGKHSWATIPAFSPPVTDREQTRRDIERGRANHAGMAMVLSERCDALLTELEQAEAKLAAATTMLAEAEKIVPGIIQTAGRFSIEKIVPGIIQTAGRFSIGVKP